VLPPLTVCLLLPRPLCRRRFSECAETDRFVWDHPEFLPIFSSGNYGDKGVQSVVSPGTAKNALCVGATANVMLVAGAPKAYYCAVPLYSPFTSSLADTSPFTAIGDGSGLAALARSGVDIDHIGFEDESVHMSRLLSTVSGTGQTYDTRFKPELLAPGQVRQIDSRTDEGQQARSTPSTDIKLSDSRELFLFHFV